VNFSELREELFARGTSYLSEDAASSARADRWLNQAYREICNLHVWPFLVTEVTGTAGAGQVSIPDLRKLLLVADASVGTTPGYILGRSSYEDLAQDGEDLSQAGTPALYWMQGTSTVRAFPVGGTIYVRYARRVDELSGTQTPLFDEEYHDLIVDRAMIKAYKDSDNFEAAAALRQEFDAGMTAMAEDYQVYSRDVMYLDPGTLYDG
jgi:hypothetical protein